MILFRYEFNIKRILFRIKLCKDWNRGLGGYKSLCIFRIGYHYSNLDIQPSITILDLVLHLHISLTKKI
jgi:hypothetical protein